MKKVEKLIRDGKVGVIISCGFGGGWYREEYPELIFNPKLIEMVEKNIEITPKFILDNFGIEINRIPNRDLCVDWVDKGVKFMINEYDGQESILTIQDLTLKA